MTGSTRPDGAGDDIGALFAAVVADIACGPVDAVAAVAAVAAEAAPWVAANSLDGADVGPRLPDEPGSLVATATSRGANPTTVEPGRTRGNRRTTAAGAAALLAPGLAWPARLAVVATAADAGPGATVRIALADAGLTVAVLRSSRAVPAARSSAEPCGAAVDCSADAVRASPPIDASASPPTGRYDDGPASAGVE